MYKIIVNPESGRGAGKVQLPQIEEMLKKRGLKYSIECAASPEEATRIARVAAGEDLEGVIAIGGDGTLFQIVNGMCASAVPLLFVPCGTGNDFVRCLNLPKDPVQALEQQLDSPVTQIDVGCMNDLHFMNVAGTGFDADVLRYVDKYKTKYAGILPYLYALKDALKEYRPMNAMVSVDGGPEERASFAIVSIGNGRFIGGGMKAVPNAEIDDGYFDVVMVKPVRKAAVIPLIAFYIAGKHISLGLASVRRCKKFSVRCDNMTVNLDGELRDTNYARFELLPGALRVRIPKKKA